MFYSEWGTMAGSSPWILTKISLLRSDLESCIAFVLARCQLFLLQVPLTIRISLVTELCSLQEERTHSSQHGTRCFLSNWAAEIGFTQFRRSFTTTPPDGDTVINISQGCHCGYFLVLFSATSEERYHCYVRKARELPLSLSLSLLLQSEPCFRCAYPKCLFSRGIREGTRAPGKAREEFRQLPRQTTRARERKDAKDVTPRRSWQLTNCFTRRAWWRLLCSPPPAVMTFCCHLLGLNDHALFLADCKLTIAPERKQARTVFFGCLPCC